MKYQTQCEVDQGGILCSNEAIGILVWKKTELTLAVCQEHADKVTSKRVELKRFNQEVA